MYGSAGTLGRAVLGLLLLAAAPAGAQTYYTYAATASPYTAVSYGYAMPVSTNLVSQVVQAAPVTYVAMPTYAAQVVQYWTVPVAYTAPVAVYAPAQYQAAWYLR